jgi:hypothetical protein
MEPVVIFYIHLFVTGLIPLYVYAVWNGVTLKEKLLNGYGKTQSLYKRVSPGTGPYFAGFVHGFGNGFG